MKPTNDDAQNRRDGWFEHRGVWGEVVVGTVLANYQRRSERWEVIATSHGEQVDYGNTLWFRIREQTTGVEHSVSPKMKKLPVTILTQNPADTYAGDPTPPSDSESIMLLVRELGAEVLATRDERTGEVTCPMYWAGHNHPGEREPGHSHRGEIEHMKFAHDLVVDPDIAVMDLANLHAQAHDARWPNIGKGGFPHRHVPEDLSVL